MVRSAAHSPLLTHQKGNFHARYESLAGRGSPASFRLPRCYETWNGYDSGGGPALIWVIPGDGEDRFAARTRHLGRLPPERCALAAARADGVLRAPAERHVDRVAGTRHHGPAVGPHGDDLDGRPGDADRSLADGDDRLIGGEPKQFVPGPPAGPEIPVAADASP